METFKVCTAVILLGIVVCLFLLIHNFKWGRRLIEHTLKI